VVTDKLVVSVQANELLGEEPKNFTVKLRAKNSLIFQQTQQLDLLSLQKIVTINAKDVHSFSPAGGILILSIEDADEKNPQVYYERLVFVLPEIRFDEQAVAIRTNYAEDSYAPGDLTDLTVTIDTAQLG
jgi:hypothetical protein